MSERLVPTRPLPEPEEPGLAGAAGGHAAEAAAAEAPGPRRRALLRAFAASLTGTALEWYDFAIFSSCAALVFGPLFFAQDEPMSALFASFATYAAGYVARPLGGLLFGRLGDLIGRRKVLVVTLLLVGVATFLIGLLPTYAAIGPLAPALLVLLRFAQGVGVGGEWAGAVLITAERSDERDRGFWASAAQVGPPAGTLLANGVLALLLLLPAASFQSWGWRVAFLLSAVLVGFGLWIRTRVEETLPGDAAHPHAPVTELLRSHRRALAAAMLARIGPDVLYAMFAVFVLAYAERALGLRTAAVTAVVMGSFLQLVLVPASGWLSDRAGRRRVYAAGAIGAMLWTVGFFAWVHGPVSLAVGVMGALGWHSAMYGPQAAFIAEQFPAHLRSTGSALAYTFAGLAGGAIAPLVFTALLARFPPWSIGVYIVFACAVTLAGLGLGRR